MLMQIAADVSRPQSCIEYQKLTDMQSGRHVRDHKKMLMSCIATQIWWTC